MTTAKTSKPVEIRLSQASHDIEKSLRSLSALVSGIPPRTEADDAMGGGFHSAMDPLTRAVRAVISAKSELDAARAILIDAGMDSMSLPRSTRRAVTHVRRLA